MLAIESYFRAEKSESLVFLILGVIAIALVTYLVVQHRTSLTTGLAIPLLLVGLIQVVVGGTIYLRTDQQLAALEAQYAVNPAAFAAAETPRIADVSRSFSVYKLVEIAFILIGVGLIYFRQQNDFWLGLGLGMLVQGTAMLTADVFAERRAAEYSAFVAASAAR